MNQKGAFLSTEGDAYFTRNRNHDDSRPDLLATSLRTLQIRPKRILEIGCSNGHRLKNLRASFGSECYGIDPSSAAVTSGHDASNGIHLTVGTADKLEFDDEFFDVVIFGFCLYLCDPKDHFLIGAEANRVLNDGGFLVISDFLSKQAYRNPYSHKPGIFSYKMEFARMFLWHPSYRLLSRTYYEHTEQLGLQADDALSIDIMRKDVANAFPLGTRTA
jgi:ubiquinone/menaquinone biosynthesis C-methylase UbiE